MIANRSVKDAFELETKLAKQSITDLEQDGCFSGYASLFGKTDLGQEVVAAGAFANSLNARGSTGIRMLFQHNPDEPIGHWLDVREDQKGLFVKGKLNLGVERGREIYALIQSGDIDGLSIGFKTIKARREKRGQIRRILEADLWEISIVTFPMLPEARVTQVKTATLPSPRELERWLVRDAGLTRSQAKATIANGYASIAGVRDAADNHKHSKYFDHTDLTQKISQAAKMLRTL